MSYREKLAHTWGTYETKESFDVDCIEVAQAIANLQATKVRMNPRKLRELRALGQQFLELRRLAFQHGVVIVNARIEKGQKK